MSLNFKNALGAFEPALKLRAERAAVLSNNLANVNTPNFKARDVDFHETLKAKMATTNSGSTIAKTHSGHMDFKGGNWSSSEMMFRIPTQPSIDGNTVEEHIEHSEYMKNSLEFQTAFTFLNSRFKGLSKALTGQ